MTIQIENQFYSPTFITPTTFGEDLIFEYPVIGVEAIEIFEITESGTRTFVSVNDYTLTLTGIRPEFAGGVVVFTRAYLDDTSVISIERNTPITQLTDFFKKGEFAPNVIEFTADKLTMICQEIAYRKCSIEGGPFITTEITQLTDWYPYGPFTLEAIDSIIEKLTTICQEIKAAKQDCSNDLENT